MSQEAEPTFLTMTKDIQKQIAELQVQVAKFSTCSSQKPEKRKTVVNTKQKVKNTQSDGQLKQIAAMVKPKPWYCFKCGEDDHIASTCSNIPNPALVQAKKAQLREKRHAWEAQNGSPTVHQLN